MSLFRMKKTGGLMDEIRCDESSYLIWKWHPTGVQRGTRNRENAIRWGSSLRVKDGEVAVLVYSQMDCTGHEIAQEYIEGPCDRIIETENFPVLANIVGLAYEGGTPLQAEIYFINLAKIIQLKFGVPFFDVFDPRFDDFGVPVAVRGTISFSIGDYRKFIKLHRLNSFDMESFQNQLKDTIARYVKDVVTNAPAVHNISVIQLESKIGQINDVIEYDLSERLKEDFGIVVSGIDVGAIEIDKSSDGYRQLMSVTKDVTGYTARAEAEAKIKDIAEKQRIEAEHYEESLRIQRKESQYAQHKATQSANIKAFQTEKQAEVGIAGANALGKMGTNGAGNISFGSDGNSGGINMAALMTNMAVGGAVGQSIASTMSGMMNNINHTLDSDSIPPIPVVSYYVANDGKATGPFDFATLKKMVSEGIITAESLVWKSGMAVWEKAQALDDLKDLFEMPPIPAEND